MPTSQSQQRQEAHDPQPATRGNWQWLRRGRSLVIALVTMLTLLSAAVAIGQVSQDYDLACRGLVASGGGVTSSGNFAVIGALGIPFAPPKNSDTAPTYAVRSADFAVRGGFLPGYPNGQSAGIADTGTTPTNSEQATVQHLPLIFKMRRIIRGGC